MVDVEPSVKVGVRLDAEPNALGVWLADGSAYDAAGADALWIDVGPDVSLDTVSLAAALAVMTAKARVTLVLGETDVPSAQLARGLETVRRLSHERLALAVDAEGADALTDLLPDVPILRREPDGSGWVDPRAGAGDLARWLATPTPEGRAGWRETRAQAAARGAYGIVVPSHPLLLDVLRNPGDPGGRGDLRLAQG
ncbi:MAG TPA: hypothetical protein VEX15_11815 [Nocardioidaceae bacterium]|nr:hypothetical protein [Nocardioidaceae bacterium]